MPQVQLTLSEDQARQFQQHAREQGCSDLAAYVMKLLEADLRESVELETELESRLTDGSVPLKGDDAFWEGLENRIAHRVGRQ